MFILFEHIGGKEVFIFIESGKYQVTLFLSFGSPFGLQGPVESWYIKNWHGEHVMHLFKYLKSNFQGFDFTITRRLLRFLEIPWILAVSAL